ncbi:50S ribosomal protein L21 [candidate division KSB1 bacterium]|nr:MAG: 50S ribosomal protein L21 [candidate division KSB1 bacterium]RKY87432.1 MAG: 50S ribosomal protein L21 [candidate division KSB1 bacterium]
MYAIVDIAGKQMKIQENDQLVVPRLEGKEGSAVLFEKVLLIADNGEVKIGQPIVEGVRVEASILAHGKGKKIIVFKKKRRKDYKVKKGHRQPYTKIKIEKIVVE